MKLKRKSLELFYEEYIYEDKKGEIKVVHKYFIFHPDLAIRIYLKPVDSTASDILKFLAHDCKIINIPK